MNSSLGNAWIAASLASLLLWSAGVHADQASNEKAAADTQQETREQAENAFRESINDALVRISAATRLALDVDLPARAAPPVSGD